MMAERVTNGSYHCSFGMMKGGMGAAGQVPAGPAGLVT